MTFIRRLSLSLLTAGAFLAEANASNLQVAQITPTEEIDAITYISGPRKRLTTDPVVIKDVNASTSTFYDKASIGTASMLTTSKPQYFRDDGNGNVFAALTNGTNWETYSGAIASSYSTSGTVNITQTLSDGVSATTKILKINLTKATTGTIANLTQANLIAYLEGLTSASLLTTTGGTQLTGFVTPTTGWTIKLALDNGSGTLLASTLSPVSSALSLPITPYGSNTAHNFNINLSLLDTYNVATNATTGFDLTLFGTTNSDNITLTCFPAKLDRTKDIPTSILSMLNNSIPSKYFSQTHSEFYPSLYNAIVDLRNSKKTTVGNLSLKDMSNLDLINASNSTALTSARMKTTYSWTSVINDDYAFVSTALSDLSSVTWRVNGPQIIATATVGTDAPKDFIFDTSTMSALGFTTGKWLPGQAILFKSTDGDSIIAKMFNTSTSNTAGLDATSFTNTTDEAIDLALLMKAKFSGVVTTIKHDSEENIHKASY